MSKHVLKELPGLVRAQVINEEIAERIEAHYSSQPSQSSNRLFIVFGILGSLLIGMGIVLIIAHNWDTLPKFGKLAVGFIPLLVGQGLAAYVFFQKKRINGMEGRIRSVFIFCCSNQHRYCKPSL